MIFADLQINIDLRQTFSLLGIWQYFFLSKTFCTEYDCKQYVMKNLLINVLKIKFKLITKYKTCSTAVIINEQYSYVLSLVDWTANNVHTSGLLVLL